MYILPPLVALFVVLLPLLSTVSVLPRIRVSPGFALMDERGERLTNEDLHGEIILYGLASLDCDELCRETIHAMRDAAAQASFAADDPDQPGLRLITIIVDATDDPNELAAFASALDLEDERWSVVSGSESAIRAVVSSGFEVYLATSAAGDVVHDPGVFLTDHAGFLRAEYRLGAPPAETMAADIDRILNEASAGSVGGLLYNAAHSLSLSCGS